MKLNPLPCGAEVLKTGGVRFSLTAPWADTLTLLLFEDPADKSNWREIPFSAAIDRFGDVWQIDVEDAGAGMGYVYSCYSNPDSPVELDPKQWILDPYAKAVAGREQWNDPAGLSKKAAPKNGADFPIGIIIDDEAFDWGDDSFPKAAPAERVIYEAHLRGLTCDPGSGVRHPGSYNGLIEKLPYLRSLGITSLELLPIQEFDELEYFREEGARSKLKNYWGYSTMAFMAPMARYAYSGIYGQQVVEFKKLVRACHREGLEIILDVVYNHTAEGGADGPQYSFKNLDRDAFYIIDAKDEHFHNYSGCGNTVNANQARTRDFILQTLRYWHSVMHVDGFRFDLASCLTRGKDGAPLPSPPLIDAIESDPILKDCILIAEAWDAGGLYQVGSFPSEKFMEWNGRYRDDIRKFWRGDGGMLPALATRLMGSPDLYAKGKQSPQKSINFITSHDGFTMHDLVSYADKHNEANGESNRDGDNSNHSCNYGVEGPTDNARILDHRLRHTKNLLSTLFISQGVPMLLGGDEFGRTQQGSNNAYCQDNEISWFDWDMINSNSELHALVKRLINLRKRHAALRHTAFLNDQPDSDTPHVLWFAPKGQPLDWNGQTIACLLHSRETDFHKRPLDSVFAIFNASEHRQTYALPKLPGRTWQLLVSTEKNTPRVLPGQQQLTIGAQSLTLMAANQSLGRKSSGLRS